MPISDFHASTIVKVEVNFGFSGFTCHPSEISVQLGIDPDEVRVKGESRVTRGGRKIAVPFSSWRIGSRCHSKDVNVHVRELLARLKVANRPFLSAWGEPHFGVLWKGNYLYAGSGPFYERDVLGGIAECGAALYHDIYQVDEE